METIGSGVTSPQGSEQGERLMGSFAMSFSHGLLIIRDKGSVSTHDRWDSSASGINVESDSIYLAVLNAIDGVVKVNFIEGGEPDLELICVYLGSLEVPSGKMVAHDPDGDITAVFYVEPGFNQLRVEVDHDGDASVVNVRFNPAGRS
jgi:hypothetical protein